MGIRPHVVAVLVASLLGLGHPSADPAPGWVVLTISRVQVKPKKIDGSTWDLPRERKDSNCPLVATVGNMAAGTVGGVIATFLCSHAAPGQRDFSAPDLLVQLVAGDARYRTPVALDTFAEAFGFPVIVPLEAIPPAGLEVQVLDQDDDVGTGELIGLVRLTRTQMQQALASSTPLLTMSDSQLERIEIEVAAYSAPSRIEPYMFQVNQEPAAVPIRARAGELVMISARGKFSVASNFEEIHETGYLRGEKRGFNRTPDFKDANHGAAVALIGASHASHAAFVVGSCAMAVATTPGQIFVGVNDSSVGNNHGSILFGFHVGLPTVAQWRSGGAFECPRPPSHRDHAPVLDSHTDADLPDGINPAMITDGLARVKRAMAACRTRSPARGMVKFAVTVGSDGRVTDVTIKAAPDRALADCVATAARNATFARTKAGGAFSYAFTF
jgi:hypothetical protein